KVDLWRPLTLHTAWLAKCRVKYKNSSFVFRGYTIPLARLTQYGCPALRQATKRGLSLFDVLFSSLILNFNNTLQPGFTPADVMQPLATETFCKPNLK
ncbi:MAG: hypothetical protein ABIU77_24630, partial [Ferruginibacter sp.]